MSNFRQFNSLFMPLSIFKVEMFFSFAALFGYIYLGSDVSPIYIGLMTVIGVLNIGIGIIAIFKSPDIRIRDLILLIGFPLFVFVSLIYGKISSRTATAVQQSQFNSFLAFTLPSLFIGWYSAKNQVDSFKSVFIVMVLSSIGSIVSILEPFILGRGFTVMGGASYQSASYYTSFAFGVNLYFLIHKTNYSGLKFLNSLLMEVLQIILLLLQAVMVIIPGGRGAFVLMIAYIVLATSRIITKRNILHFVISIILILMLGLLLIKVFSRLLENSIFQLGFNRAVAFIGPGGALNWEGSSGRLPIYLESIELFKQSPLIGHGLYEYLSKVSFKIYPHNLFLELLLQGGIIYLLIGVVFIGYLLRKLIFLIKIDKKNQILLYLVLYPIVMLMFSGSYLTDGLLWFVISFITFYRKKIALSE